MEIALDLNGGYLHHQACNTVVFCREKEVIDAGEALKDPLGKEGSKEREGLRDLKEARELLG